MVDLHNVGTFNADMRFKAGYLNELERMLEKVLPHAMLKAKPNLESRIRTLKRDLTIVYDMLSGKDNGSFCWDKHSSIASEMLIQGKLEMVIQESAQKLYLAFCEVEGLTKDEPYRVLSKILDHPMQMLAFFSLISAV
ncbi:hypothetical protein Golob_005547 [Gossypium lobatum]|uniref:Myb/SANT-like domain-containing protein n=1 Tax=Gossypium lobatum TaxID=34289 RepID=A0A7J8MTI3_9ROSI|nr:hypothetical protein [Gossypium lobatum]